MSGFYRQELRHIKRLTSTNAKAVKLLLDEAGCQIGLDRVFTLLPYPPLERQLDMVGARYRFKLLAEIAFAEGSDGDLWAACESPVQRAFEDWSANESSQFRGLLARVRAICRASGARHPELMGPSIVQGEVAVEEILSPDGSLGMCCFHEESETPSLVACFPFGGERRKMTRPQAFGGAIELTGWWKNASPFPGDDMWKISRMKSD